MRIDRKIYFEIRFKESVVFFGRCYLFLNILGIFGAAIFVGVKLYDYF